MDENHSDRIVKIFDCPPAYAKADCHGCPKISACKEDMKAHIVPLLKTSASQHYQRSAATSNGSLWAQGNFSKGQYISKKSVIYRAINLTELTEEESGMRDARRVEP